jgi:hypothetical protein
MHCTGVWLSTILHKFLCFLCLYLKMFLTLLFHCMHGCILLMKMMDDESEVKTSGHDAV